MKRPTKILTLAFIFAVTSGFRVFGDRWQIATDEPTVWLKFASDDLTEDFAVFDADWDLGAIRLLNPEEQRRALIRSVMAEYNNISTSFLRLSFFPITDLVAAGDTELDSTFSQEAATGRTITIKQDAAGGPFTAGYAQPQAANGVMTSCNIVMGTNIHSNAKEYYTTLLHEVGHCLGLQHNHADADANMGYNSTTTHLGIDDQMAITHLYPLKPEYGAEAATLGLTCQQQGGGS